MVTPDQISTFFNIYRHKSVVLTQFHLISSSTKLLELLSDRARADTSAPGSSSWLSNMEFSSNSMTDNSFDKDNPLKQVLQLCSTLAGKGCDFSISVRIRDCFSFSLKSGKPQPQQAKKRSPSFYRRQERRRLLRKKNTDHSGNSPSQRERHRLT